MPTEEVSLLLKGEPGSKVKLEYKRPGLGPVQTCELTRKVVLLRDVPLGMTLDDKAGIGYVQLKGFSTTAPAELAYVIGQLQSNGPLKTLILDLRGNPGGLLSSAIKVWTLRPIAGPWQRGGVSFGSVSPVHVRACAGVRFRVSASKAFSASKAPAPRRLLPWAPAARRDAQWRKCACVRARMRIFSSVLRGEGACMRMRAPRESTHAGCFRVSLAAGAHGRANARTHARTRFVCHCAYTHTRIHGYTHRCLRFSSTRATGLSRLVGAPSRQAWTRRW